MLSVDATDRPDAVRDLVRDTAADLGLGLVRLQVDHRRIEDVFADPDPGPDGDPDGDPDRDPDPDGAAGAAEQRLLLSYRIASHARNSPSGSTSSQ